MPPAHLALTECKAFLESPALTVAKDQVDHEAHKGREGLMADPVTVGVQGPLAKTAYLDSWAKSEPRVCQVHQGNQERLGCRDLKDQ